MKTKPCFLLLILFMVNISLFAQDSIDGLLPVRGFCIAAPRPDNLEPFIQFIDNELAPRKVNTLVLRVDWNYQYKSYPQLQDSIALSKAEVKQIVETCRKHNIELIPHINLLGHQSWHSTTLNLLREFPEFNETPHIEMPEEYKWPNEDGLYCLSYCPLHPEVHDVVFAAMDEIMDVFEAKIFHAGMDEVFYIGDDKCPRCRGKDKAELFAGEVRLIRDHLAQNDRELWIWGDRLIDGATTGMGMWEASMNNTYRAIDMIPKDVVICDWHYERPDPTAVYFAMKGFRVITCPYRNPDVAVEQMNNMITWRRNSTAQISERFMGMMQTVWSDAEQYLDQFYGKRPPRNQDENSVACFKKLFEAMNKETIE